MPKVTGTIKGQATQEVTRGTSPLKREGWIDNYPLTVVWNDQAVQVLASVNYPLAIWKYNDVMPGEVLAKPYCVSHYTTGLRLSAAISEQHAYAIAETIIRCWKQELESIKSLVKKHEAMNNPKLKNLMLYCDECNKLGKYIPPTRYV